MINTLRDAINFYETLGYVPVWVPHVVDTDVSAQTKPANVPDIPHVHGKVYSASAEQGFLQLYKEGALNPGKYMAVTPCIRPERELSNTYYTCFLKLELFSFGEGIEYNELLNDARVFMSSYIKEVLVETTEEGKDIIAKGIELGSYGKRSFPDGIEYVYGTGLAEPRFTYCKEL